MVQGLLEGDKDSSPSVQNDRVFRLTMTGLEPLAARPIGASAIDARASDWTPGPVRAAPAQAFGQRPNCRERKEIPGQGRPRGGVWPTAKLPRAQKNTRESLQLVLKLLGVLIARPCIGADRRPPLMRRPRGAIGRKANWRERKKTSNFCWNWIFVGAIPRAQKSCNFCWNCLFP